MEPQIIKMTPWKGGECPVPEGTPGLVRFRDGTVYYTNNLADWNWKHYSGPVLDKVNDDIIEYAVVKTETAPPALRDLRGWVVDGNGDVWWADEDGVRRGPTATMYRRSWKDIEDSIRRDGGRVYEQLRPLTSADLEVKE